MKCLDNQLIQWPDALITIVNIIILSYDEVEHTSTFSAPIVSSQDVPAYTVDVLVPATAAPTPQSRSAAPSGANTPALREPKEEKRTVTVSEITSVFLKTLYDSATDFIGAAPTGVVISCPSFFNDKQKEALTKAATEAGIPVIQLLDETAAALVAYRVGLVEERKERDLLGSPDEGDAGKMESRDKTVAVVDLGETSLCVTVAQTGEGEYVKLSQIRDDKMGGRAFDDVVSRTCCTSMCRDHPLILSPLSVFCSCAPTLPRSSPKRPRSPSTCHASPTLRSPTSVPR